LFASQQGQTADEPEELIGEAVLDDGNEVSGENLVHVLV